MLDRILIWVAEHGDVVLVVIFLVLCAIAWWVGSKPSKVKTEDWSD